MKKTKVAAMMLGLASLPVVMAKSEFHVDGFLTASGAVLSANKVYAPVLNPNTMLARANATLAPAFTLTQLKPEINAYNSKPEFQQDSVIALQGSMDFTDKLGMTIQVLSKGAEQWDIDAEWAFLNYQLSNDWRVRTGRLRIPNFMFSESLEVGYSYPWVRLPLEVYSLGPIDNYSGVDLAYSNTFAHQNIEAIAYYGSSSEAYNEQYQPQFLRYRQIMGGSVTAGNDDAKLRVGYMEGHLQLLPASSFALALQTYAEAASNPTAVAQFSYTDVKTKLFSVGGIFQIDRWRLLAEWVDSKANTPALPDQNGYYGTLGYRFDKLMPYVGYAHLKTTDKNDRVYAGSLGTKVNQTLALFNQDQETYTIGIRYDIIPDTAIKFQADNIKALHGTNGLFNTSPNEAVILYSAVINVVF